MTIINWENVSTHSTTFQNQSPFKFGFVETIFENSFYQKLFETYPKLNEFKFSAITPTAIIVRTNFVYLSIFILSPLF